jgi:hypothetical protein
VNEKGWRPLRRSQPEKQGAEGFIVTPFVRLARVHAFSAAADGAITAALAGSIFFSISPEESRGRVALALLLTMAPFALVTPLIGPAIDRLKGGRRVMIMVTLVGRAIVAFLMIRHFDTLLLFPEAFGILVLQKGYAVAKSAVVPQFVKSDQDFVGANSRLSLISSISGPLGAGVAGVFSLVGGPAIAAAIAMIGFIIATVLSFQLPPIVVADRPVEAAEKAELRDAKILLAATSMMVIRGVVGFVTLLFMFELRGGKDGLDVSVDGAAFGAATATARGDTNWVGDPRSPIWHFGLVVLFAVTGSLSAARVAPAIRQRVNEERMLASALGLLVAMSVFAGLNGEILGTALLALAASFGTVTGKLAFDALVQRDAPDANYGRSFARFEARFQLAFSVGAFIPVVIPLGIQFGSWLVAISTATALASYVVGGPGRVGLLRRREAVASDDPDPVSDKEEVDETIELTVDDIRPSQPATPTAAIEWSAPETWDDTTPYVSSIDGVEVDPAPLPPKTEDRGDDAIH